MSTVFGQIIAGKLPCEKVFENERILAIKDIIPAAPVHILIMPKKEIADLQSLQPEDLPLIAEIIQVAQKLAEEFEITDGYRLLTNSGSEAGQTVFHLHFHLLGEDGLRIWVSVFFLFVSPLIFASEDELVAKHVYDHLLIRDATSAVEAAKRELVTYPESKALQRALIRALCEKGDEVEALEYWKKMTERFKEEGSNRNLLEVLAWGVLNKGERSSQLFIRLNALIGVSLTHDARALPILLANMRDTNALLRSLAIRFSSNYGDAPLQNELARLLKEEKNWYVRLEVIKAVGQQRIESLKKTLKDIVGNPKTMVQEKAAAILSLVSMYDTIDSEELRSLVQSNRAGLRQLACDLIAHLDLKAEIGKVVSLLCDDSADVRVAALNTLGLLRIVSHQEKPILDAIRPMLKDPAPQVAITAAWAAMLLQSPEGEEKLKKWMSDSNPDWRGLASAALAATGSRGVPLAWKEIQENKDPYVRVNLAMGLMGQRKHIRESCDIIHDVFVSEKETRWMWDHQHNPLFRSLAPSQIKHIAQIPHYPMVVDQLVRIEVLSVLSVMRYSRAQELVKGFLQHEAWGVTGAASITLIEEGDEEAFELVRGLLNDPEEKVRVQAALILALLGGDTAAVKVLQDAYPHLDREMKIYVLETLGHVGDAQTIPFLVEILKEPYQVLRVVAASALIQCLYH